jgi:hypothetical protein
MGEVVSQTFAELLGLEEGVQREGERAKHKEQEECRECQAKNSNQGQHEGLSVKESGRAGSVG